MAKTIDLAGFSLVDLEELAVQIRERIAALVAEKQAAKMRSTYV